MVPIVLVKQHMFNSQWSNTTNGRMNMSLCFADKKRIFSDKRCNQPQSLLELFGVSCYFETMDGDK